MSFMFISILLFAWNHASIHGFMIPPLFTVMHKESYRRQEAEEVKLPEGQQRMMIVIDQNYLLPEGTKLTQDKYDFSNEKDIEQLKKDITTKSDKQNE